MADSAFSPQFFPELPTEGISEAASSYQFTLQDGQRIASHSTHRVNIKPQDEYRYGYRLWLEEQSGLLLQWELVGSKGESLAKLMFTELKMGAEVDPGELRVPVGDKSVPRPAPQSTSAGRVVTGKPGWQVARLPPGFRLASRRQNQSGQAPVYEHLVYSDGIAAVSVYVEPRDEKAELAQGLSTLGTTNTLTRGVNGEVVTVMGDVPVATITMIGESVQPVSH
jgi:sigma-E factor negative regulatory protein RseB